MRPSKTSERRLQLSAEQNHRCCYCGIVVNWGAPPNHPDSPTIEHVRRLADGGRRGWENEVLACYACNNSRGTASAEDHYEHIKAEGRHSVGWSAPRSRSTKIAPLPPPPLTIKLIEYFVMVYGVEVTIKLITERGQSTASPTALRELLDKIAG